MFTSITECVDQLGQHLAAEPRSKLSRTGHNWATQDAAVDVVNGIYPRADAAQMWITAGFLPREYLEPGYSQTYLDQDTDNCFNLWITARDLFGLAYPAV